MPHPFPNATHPYRCPMLINSVRNRKTLLESADSLPSSSAGMRGASSQNIRGPREGGEPQLDGWTRKEFPSCDRYDLGAITQLTCTVASLSGVVLGEVGPSRLWHTARFQCKYWERRFRSRFRSGQGLHNHWRILGTISTCWF